MDDSYKFLGLVFIAVWAAFFFYVMFTFDLAPKSRKKDR